VVVVPSVALALDLKESTDKILAGTGLFCVHDVRSEGNRGEAVAPPARVPSVAAPALAAQAVVGMEWAARPWRCETECTGCAPPPGRRQGKCYFKCGTCKNCRTKMGGCNERRDRETAWAAAEAAARIVAAVADGGTDERTRRLAAGTPTPATGGAGGRTLSRIGGLDSPANSDEKPVTEAEVREEQRTGTASHAALCDPKVVVIITTPEGLCDLDSRECRRLQLALGLCGRLERMVIDEAHCPSAARAAAGRAARAPPPGPPARGSAAPG
jgi:hypothetical protein